MNPSITVACTVLKSAWQAVLRRSAFAALRLGSFSQAQADLVAHFRFDRDLKDASGQHDGRPVDPGLAPEVAPGRVGSAVVIEIERTPARRQRLCLGRTRLLAQRHAEGAVGPAAGVRVRMTRERMAGTLRSDTGIRTRE